MDGLATGTERLTSRVVGVILGCRQGFEPMITAGATAADFSRWEEMARECDTSSLRYIVEDCKRAAENMRGWNPSREGYYIDQMCTYSDELRRRRNSCPGELSGRT